MIWTCRERVSSWKQITQEHCMNINDEQDEEESLGYMTSRRRE